MIDSDLMDDVLSGAWPSAAPLEPTLLEKIMSATERVNMVCGTCGSPDVVRDAWAAWSEGAQEWELQNVFDDAYCEACEGECSIEEQPL